MSRSSNRKFEISVYHRPRFSDRSKMVFATVKFLIYDSILWAPNQIRSDKMKKQNSHINNYIKIPKPSGIFKRGLYYLILLNVLIISTTQSSALAQEDFIRVIAIYNQQAVSGQGSITSPAGISEFSAAAVDINSKIRSTVASLGIERFNPIGNLPVVTIETTTELIEQLRNTNQFALIVEDRIYPPVLNSSGNIIGTPVSRLTGADGNGTTVAILDTGVDAAHPFFSGRVVEGACYSSNVPQHGATSFCPGGNPESTSLLSSANCSGADGCDHGTHVAGIAAGKAYAGNQRYGVAPESNIFAIQVFSRFTDASGITNCADNNLPSPCALSYTSDQIKGLFRVNQRSNQLNIVAANMSLGGGGSNTNCDDDPMKPIVDLLLTNGVATVIASGNNGFTNMINSPGCISSAFTVSSTTDSDSVSIFSNLSNTVDVFAPGSDINSSIPNGGFAPWDGTSMATPQVTGAIAALSSKYPGINISTLLSGLSSSGVPVTDDRSAGTITKPRIDLEAAIVELNPLTFIDFATFEDSRYITGSNLEFDGIRIIEAAPVNGYCESAVPIILGPGGYNSPTSNLSTADPQKLNKCNGAPISLTFENPGKTVKLRFYGANVDYKLEAFRSDGSKIAESLANAVPYKYDEPYEIFIESNSADIDSVIFGYSAALTLIKDIEVTY